jgi:threonyl-tRNA synthetase
MRVRSFTQDDAHIFCTADQVEPEVVRFIDLLQRVYADFGFDEILIKLSTRPAKRVGTDQQWDRSEAVLKTALERKGLRYDLQPGEGAFYGPKIEFSLKDSIGRVWQCGTMQLDFSMPERLGAEFVGEDNARHVPVMLHRAILGSFERFIGILVEHYAGAMPLWLAPLQVVVMSITDRQSAYASDVVGQLKQAGLRAAADLRNEKISYKIREHSLQKLPYQVIVGDQEVSARKVAVRNRKGEDLGQMSLADFVSKLRTEEARLGRAARD